MGKQPAAHVELSQALILIKPGSCHLRHVRGHGLKFHMPGKHLVLHRIFTYQLFSALCLVGCSHTEHDGQAEQCQPADFDGLGGYVAFAHIMQSFHSLLTAGLGHFPVSHGALAYSLGGIEKPYSIGFYLVRIHGQIPWTGGKPLIIAF